MTVILLFLDDGLFLLQGKQVKDVVQKHDREDGETYRKNYMKGVIFDLDGVIVSTDDLHYEAWRMLAYRLGITTYTREDNERQRGVSRMESLEVLLEKSERQYTTKEKVALAEEKNDIYKGMLETIGPADLLAGVLETIHKLKRLGILIGIGSASKNTRYILERLEIVGLFDAICDGTIVTKSKPDPEVFEAAADMLQLPYTECVVVEDSLAGIQAAKACGMRCIGVGLLHGRLGADYHAIGLNSELDWEKILKK